MMVAKLRDGWTWFVEGLVEAVLWLADRARRGAPVRVALGGAEPSVAGPGGAPPDLPRRIAGAAVDLVVPPNWVTRRDLDPVALASRPFLDAFVRHQIGRVTPWRVEDTHYRVLAAPLPDDPKRLGVAVAVVPRRLVAPALSWLEPLRPGPVRLLAADDPAGSSAIALGAGRPELAAKLRRGVVAGLGALALGTVALVGLLQWQAAAVQGDIDEQDRVLDERKAVLARERRAADPGAGAAARLAALRAARPSVLAVLDALSGALPDSAHLTALSIEGDHVAVAGLSSEPSALVPALETSGAFAGVSFGGATTRGEDGAGDRFSLDMTAIPPRSDHAAAPPGDATARAAP